LKETLDVRVDRKGTSWIIRERGYPNSVGIPVDALVMTATRYGEGFAEGRIVSVHGLDQGVAACLNAAQMGALGVGAYTHGHAGVNRFGFKRIHLMTDGRIQGA
jgi:hypothetical protein